MRKLNILYAEDDVQALETLTNILQNFDFIGRIDTAYNGNEALALYNKNDDYDILITDLKMPKKNGFELISEIKQSNKNIFTIITTAFEEVEYLKSAIDLGVDKFINKPLDITTLLGEIQSYYEKIIKEIEYEHQKSILEFNSRLITMGEMMDSIAHQWSQPLTVISLENSMNELVYKELGISDDRLTSSLKHIDENCKHLHETLSEFRSFLRPNNDYEHFLISDCINKALSVLKYIIKLDSLNVNLDIKEDFTVDGYLNQFTHIIINLINNSKDAFNDNEIEDRQINIEVDDKKIIYTDNAGGIPLDIINSIFESNITSKSYGTGMGLCMSKKIAKNNGYDISVSNIENGSKFTIEPSK